MPKINFLFLCGILLSLGGCSSQNVSGEWDCPRQIGHGCITIDEADQIAVGKLNSKEPSTLEDIEKDKIIQKKEYKVWLAPRIDMRKGSKHEASTVYYYEEIADSQDNFDKPASLPGENNESAK